MEEIGERLRKAFVEMKKPKPQQVEEPVKKAKAQSEDEYWTVSEIENIVRKTVLDAVSDEDDVSKVEKREVPSSEDLYKKLKGKRGLNYF